MESKRCAVCKEEKELTKFRKHGVHYSTACRVCVASQNEQERQNKDRREQLAALRKTLTKEANDFGRKQGALTSDELSKALASMSSLVSQMKKLE